MLQAYIYIPSYKNIKLPTVHILYPSIKTVFTIHLQYSNTPLLKTTLKVNTVFPSAEDKVSVSREALQGGFRKGEVSPAVHTFQAQGVGNGLNAGSRFIDPCSLLVVDVVRTPCFTFPRCLGKWLLELLLWIFGISFWKS